MATIIIVPLVFWAGLLAAAFAKELNLPSWLPRAVLIVYALALGLYIVGGSLSFGLRWSERLFEQHRSRLRILALLPGYVLLACVAWLIIAVASRQVPDGTPVPLIALLLAPGVLIGIVFGIVRGKRK